MDLASVGQSIARVGVLAVGTPALVIFVLALIFLLLRNPKVFRIRMIGLHYEGFEPSRRARQRVRKTRVRKAAALEPTRRPRKQ